MRLKWNFQHLKKCSSITFLDKILECKRLNGFTVNSWVLHNNNIVFMYVWTRYSGIYNISTATEAIYAASKASNTQLSTMHITVLIKIKTIQQLFYTNLTCKILVRFDGFSYFISKLDVLFALRLLELKCCLEMATLIFFFVANYFWRRNVYLLLWLAKHWLKDKAKALVKMIKL